MPAIRKLLFLALTAFLAGCNSKRKPPVDPATLQTPAAEAVVRYIVEHCPKKAEARLAVLGIGELLAAPSSEFVAKFTDVKGVTFIDHDRVVAGMIQGMSRRFDSVSSEAVLEIQMGSLTEAKNGVQEAVAAWAFKDDAGRKRLEVKANANGGFDIRELEDIPVPHRNAEPAPSSGR